MSAHPITGASTIMLGGEERHLAFDMNCAAALFESKGDGWNEWLGDRFLGKLDEGTRKVAPLTPIDTITALYALLATDREDAPREESEKSLRRIVPPVELPELQLKMLKVVLKGFGLPGESIEAVATAVDAPRKRTAAGTGTKHYR